MSSSSKKEPVRLMETWRSLFYTPIYAAVSRGFFENEGLDVEFSTCPPGHHGLSALNSGIADIVQSGPMRSIIAADWGAEVVPLHIIEINSRDGFFLVSRERHEPFQWESLKQATLIPVGFTVMPVASLKYGLKRKGVDLANICRREGLSIPDSMNAFRNGEADFIHVAQPFMEQLISEGSGHLAAAMGPVNGYISYSSFAVTHRMAAEKAEIIQRFTQGFYNAKKWLAETDAQTVAESVGSFFPDVSKDVVTKSIARYKEQNTWSDDPLLREDGYNALQDVLVEAGLVKSRQSYESIVRPDFALNAMK